jgi:hypothetical protein
MYMSDHFLILLFFPIEITSCAHHLTYIISFISSSFNTHTHTHPIHNHHHQQQQKHYRNKFTGLYIEEMLRNNNVASFVTRQLCMTSDKKNSTLLHVNNIHESGTKFIHNFFFLCHI